MVKIALAQSEPVWYDLQGSVAKTIRLIKEAALNGAELIAFPEVFIPGYPMHLWENAANIDLNLKYIGNSLAVDSEEFQKIRDQCSQSGINVVLGFSEKESGDQHSIYMSQAIIDKTGKLKLKRRKIKPTHVERALFGEGNCSDLSTVQELKFEEQAYKVGCLNCWEHAQPLLVFNSAARNEQIHVGGWPALNDKCKDSLNSMSIDGAHALAASYAIQTQSYYLFTTSIVTENIHKCLDSVPPMFKVGSGGASAVFAPDGTKICESSDPQFDGLIYENVDKEEIVLCKHFLDIVGHYSMADLLSLNIHSPNQRLVSRLE